MKSYNVRIWGIRRRASKSAPFQVRWTVAGKVHQAPFATKTLADARRAQLLTASRVGEPFDVATGLPLSELREITSPTWYEHACAYSLMKWPRSSAKHRASIAEALAVVIPTLVTTRRGVPDPRTLRTALYQWAFRAVQGPGGVLVGRPTVEEPPAEISTALAWLASHSMRVSELENPDLLRPALEATSRLLNGRKAAENTARRKVMVLSNFLRYTVEEKGLLPFNPLDRVDWSTPEADGEIDFRYVPDPALARSLIAAVRRRGARGQHLEGFFGCIYYASTRPSEAAALKDRDFDLPPDTPAYAEAWGVVLVEESRPEVGSGWTDDGTPYEKRGLKHRTRKAYRSVPIPPVLVRMIRAHIAAYGVAPDGRIFRGADGGRVSSTEYCDVWASARTDVLTEAELETPLAKVPSLLRSAGVSLWIKAGVDPVEVARRAGHSVAVLFRFYARILRGQQNVANEKIDAALSEGSDQ
ncbi:site-specific integrase [Streptomyces sp. NPDC020875]|uniref:tyrosine-type recombinase/integrase n=1 Tax=Streptomyces sp. NPDC020875 TaxID=3154898 RepID=UPI0033D03CC5